MNNLKRLNIASKGGSTVRHGGKPKDIKLVAARKNMDSSPESECRVSFPVVRSIDNNRILPRYTAVLSRSAEDGVGMEDLDRLQQDLEKLLSTTAVRHRLLKSEIESIDHQEERRKNKKSQLHDKQESSKRKRNDDKVKYKDMRNLTRPLKSRNLPVTSFTNDLPIKREVPKVIFPKNDTFDKFWLSIEPYCANVTKDVVAYLDDLIQECSQDVDTKISEVGEHYSMEWSDELLGHERFLNNAQRSVKTKNINFTNELKQNGLNAMVDTFSSPLTQRLLAALLEEKVVTKIPTVNDKLKPSDFGVFKTNNFPKNGICMDRRLKKELVEQGILDVEDLSMNIPPDDEILLEIKRCSEELRTVNEKNVSELNKLRTIVAKDLRRQEIKDALDKVDDQVLELYNKIMLIKQNDQSEDESYCKINATKQSLDEYEEEANKVVHQQIILHKELTELTNSVIPL